MAGMKAACFTGNLLQNVSGFQPSQAVFLVQFDSLVVTINLATWDLQHHAFSPILSLLNKKNQRYKACRYSSALRAASCSADFLFLPEPTPAFSPLIRTCTSNVLSCSGPVSVITLYSGRLIR